MFKTTPGSKRVLRFPEDDHPKISVKQIPPLIEKDSNASMEADVEIPVTQEHKQKISDLSVPKLNSTLCVKKTIKNVEEKKKKTIKSVADLPESEKVTLDEKITKQMNYPFDKKLYKELISLKLTGKPVFQHTTTHETVLKDRVPRLDDFFTPPQNFEYSIPCTSNLGTFAPIKQYAGMRLHKVMRTWKDNRPN